MSPLSHQQLHSLPPTYHSRRASKSGISSILSRLSVDTAPLSSEETDEFERLLSRGHSWEAAQQIIISNRNTSSAASVSASSSISSLTGNSSRFYYGQAPADSSVYSRSIAIPSADTSVSNSTFANMVLYNSVQDHLWL